jgi:hypothetical protein
MTALPQPLIRHGLRIADAKHRRPVKERRPKAASHKGRRKTKSYAAAARCDHLGQRLLAFRLRAVTLHGRGEAFEDAVFRR